MNGRWCECPDPIDPGRILSDKPAALNITEAPPPLLPQGIPIFEAPLLPLPSSLNLCP